jgi:peptidyl-prolyl cis-trans isomerase SurA
MNKKVNWIVLSLIIIMGIFGSASAEVIDRIVAIVNSDIVTMVQLNKEATPYLKNIESAGYSVEKKKAAIQQLKKQLLDALIDRSLTQQEAKRYQITVSESEIDNAVENVKRSKSLSQEDLEKAMAREGIAFDDYRDNLKKQILQSKLINHAVKSKVIITESEIKKQYKANAKKYKGTRKYLLRNILMTDEAQIKEVKAKLDQKKEFISLAKKYSMASNASDGGELGLFDINNFSQSIKDRILQLKKGGYTDIISTPQGFQVFYVQDIVMDGGKTFEQAHDEISNALYRIQVDEKYKTWFESLKKKAAIKIMI